MYFNYIYGSFSNLLLNLKSGEANASEYRNRIAHKLRASREDREKFLKDLAADFYVRISRLKKMSNFIRLINFSFYLIPSRSSC